MPTSHTVATIYNLVLDIVSERPSSGPADTGRAEVRWLNRNYQHYVRKNLRKDLWNFATELHNIARTTDPNFRWSYAWGALPNGWLRVVPPTIDGERGGEPIPFEVRDGAILTSYLYGSDGMPVELIMDRQDPGEWDDLFAFVVAGDMARAMAHQLTHKRSFVEAAQAFYQEAYDDAAMVNAFEGVQAPVEQHDVIRARYR